MYSQLILSTILASYIFQVATSITIDENSKYLFNQNEERKLGHKKRRPQSNYNTNYNPCAFGPNGVKGIRGGHKKPKSEATGRTFFDVTKVDVDYNYHYQINCGGSPILAPVVKPIGDAIKPILADGESSGHKPSGQGLFANKPVLAGLFGDRPVQNLFGITQSQSQTQTQGVLGEALFGLLPTPQQAAQGLSQGIQSFIQTIPQLGQSVQSVLPSFENFQLPSLPQLPGGGNSIFSNLFNSAVSTGSSSTANVTPAPPLTTTTDPDDIIYNDDVKPVHEDHDPILDPYQSRPPSGYYNRKQDQINYYYNRNRYPNLSNNNRFNYQQFQYTSFGKGRSINFEDHRPEGRNFRFPS